MKKEYAKPLLIVEDFTLSEHIAACDENYANHLTWVQGLNVWGYFTDNTGFTCSKEPDEFCDSDEFCYHTSVGTSVFGS